MLPEAAAIMTLVGKTCRKLGQSSLLSKSLQKLRKAFDLFFFVKLSRCSLSLYEEQLSILNDDDVRFNCHEISPSI